MSSLMLNEKKEIGIIPKNKRNSCSIRALITNARLRIKIMFVVISICFFALFSISIASYATINKLANYTRQINKTLGKSATEGASTALFNQAYDFLQVIAREQSFLCNRMLDGLKAEVELLADSVKDLFDNQQFYPYGRPVLAPSDTSNLYTSTYALAAGVKMTYELESSLDLLSHLNLLAPSLLNNENITELYVALDNGLLYFYSDRRFNDRDYDPRVRPWYVDAVKNSGEVIFTEVYEDVFGKGSVLTAAQAIYSSSGKFLGVAAVDIPISNLQERILGTRIAETGYMIIIDNCGKYLVHPDMYKEGFDPAIPKIEGDNISGYEDGLRRMMNGEEGFVSAKLNGKDIFMVFNPITVANWSIGVIVYKDELLSSLSSLSYHMDNITHDAEINISGMLTRANATFITLFVVTAILVGIVSVWLAYRISKPIQRLSAEVTKIEDGNFMYRIPVESLDEIGLLAEAYNKMMDNMSNYAQKIVSLNKQNSKLEVSANTDSLTEILNKRRFMELLDEFVKAGLSGNCDAFIIMFDLDHFKSVNDTYGHLAGDKVLKTVAQRVRAKIDSNDVFARYGGEEFIILVDKITTTDVLKLAERIRRNVCKAPVEFEGTNIPITASFGVAPLNSEDYTTAISNADKSLYKAKNSGRNKVVLYDKFE